MECPLISMHIYIILILFFFDRIWDERVCDFLCMCSNFYRFQIHMHIKLLQSTFLEIWKFSVLNLIVCILLIKVIGHRSFLLFPKYIGWNGLLFSHLALFPVFNFLSELMFGPCSIGPIPFLRLQTYSVDALIPCEYYNKFLRSHTMPIIKLYYFFRSSFFWSLSTYHCVCDQWMFLLKCK